MEVHAQEVTAAHAADAMRAAGMRCAMPWDTPEAIAKRGAAFELRTEEGACVFVTHAKAGVLWIDAAAAPQAGRGMTAAGLALAEETARRTGCDAVAFETVRRGLVRLAKRRGFEVAGVILKKKVAR